MNLESEKKIVEEKIGTLKDENKTLSGRLNRYRQDHYSGNDFLDSGYIKPGEKVIVFSGSRDTKVPLMNEETGGRSLLQSPSLSPDTVGCHICRSCRLSVSVQQDIKTPGDFMIKTEVLTLKKLKKDGSIDSSIVDSIAQSLVRDKIVLIPVDGIYGIVSIQEEKTLAAIDHVNGLKDNTVFRLISSFKMLDELASVSKMEFDFLHRIWPGEPVVMMKDIANRSRVIKVRMPRGKYKQDIVEQVGRPLHYSPAHLIRKKSRYIARKTLLTASTIKSTCS